MTTQLPISEQTDIKGHLQPDETLMWTGRPEPRFFDTSSKSCCAFGVLMLVFCTWFSILLAGFVEADGPWLLPLFVAAISLFVLIGAYVAASPLRLFRNMKRTRYALTDKRVIIFRAGKMRYSAPLAPGLLKDRHLRPDGGGDLVFDFEETHKDNNTPVLRAVGFINVPELQPVEVLLRKLIHGTAPAVPQAPECIADLERDVREYLQGCLLPGETLLWAKRPEPKFCRGQKGIILFGIAWLAIIGFFTWLNILSASHPVTEGGGELPSWFMPVFLIPFQLVSVYVILHPFLEFTARRRTVYAVTDKRILELECTGNGCTHTAYPLNPNSRRDLTIHSDGTGDITFLYRGKEITFYEVPGAAALDAIVSELVSRYANP